jgi:hypothetical protein
MEFSTFYETILSQFDPLHIDAPCLFYNDQATFWTSEEWWFDSWQGKEI